MPRPKNQKTLGCSVYRLDEKLITELRHVALDEGRPANQLLEEAIQQWVKRYREKRRDAK